MAQPAVVLDQAGAARLSPDHIGIPSGRGPHAPATSLDDTSHEWHARDVLSVTEVTIAIPVTDLRAARRWYETLLEVDGPDLEPVPGVLEYRIGGAWLQLAETGGEPGGATVRIGVPDVHQQRERLLALGAGGGDVEVVDGVIAWWDLSDPDGNRLSLYTLLAGHVEHADR